MPEPNLLIREAKESATTFTNSYGDRIYIRNYQPNISSHQKVSPFNLLAIHGMGTYHGWFDELAYQTAQIGGKLTALDLPGFGKSGIRGKLSTYHSWTEAVRSSYIDLAEKAPTYILGHSLGGIVALGSLSDMQVRPAGLILSVPAIKAHQHSYPFFEFVLPTFFKAIFSPSSKITLPFPPEFAEMIAAGTHKLDDLTREVEVSLMLETLKLSLKATSIESQKSAGFTRLLMLIAEKDQTCDWKAAERYFHGIPSPQKTLIRFEKLGHDLFILPEAPKVNQTIIDWIEFSQRQEI
ncbi:MAG: alpha/beta fold hydrolase [Candidatus Caenarcaniphilales bacterium]|nr:alpha/beta fold hydrolase [Candidatus Caenarcaniphilales bacterium]